jgi:hypothetical protein
MSFLLRDSRFLLTAHFSLLLTPYSLLFAVVSVHLFHQIPPGEGRTFWENRMFPYFTILLF